MKSGTPIHFRRDVSKLSDRELEVAAWATEGMTNKQIAQTLGLGVETIHSHLKSVYSKAGLHRASLWKLFHGN